MKIKNLSEEVVPSPITRFIQFLDSQKSDEVFTSAEIELALGYCRGAFRSSLNHPRLKPYRAYQASKHRYLYGNKKALANALKLLSQTE